MPRETKAEKGANKERESIRQQIYRVWGMDRVLDARERLCPKCTNANPCLLTPITTDGKDCPYYQERERE